MARKKKLPDGMCKRGKTYYSRFRSGGRQIRRKLSTDFRVACQLLDELKARAHRGEFGLLDNALSWKEAKAEFLRWAKQSIRNYRGYVDDMARFEKYRTVRTLREIDQAYALGYREWRLSGGGSKPGKVVVPRTINREIATLKSLMAKMVAWGRIGSNPLADLKPLPHHHLAKERRPLSLEELQAVFDHSPEYLKPVWRMFTTTGIRKQELIELRFRDVDFDRRTVTVHPSIAKNGRAREIPLDDEMLAIIGRLREEAPHRKPTKVANKKANERYERNLTKEHIFTTKANTPLRNNLLTRFYAVCERAGIPDACEGGAVDLHSLRVTFTSLTIDHGASPKAVQAILGHSSLDLTLNTYAKATERSKRDAVNVLPFAKSSAPAHVVPVQIEPKMSTDGNPQLQVVGAERVPKAS